MGKGKLIKVQIGPGQYVKMYEADAVAKGLVKAAPQVANKMQPAPQNKTVQPLGDVTVEIVPADDFTVIPGVGPATARVLQAHGITTFEQLRKAGALDYLTPNVMQAVEEWRRNG